MKRKEKIISKLIIFVLVIFLFQAILPVNAAVTTGEMSSLYSNPNQFNSKNPYRFKVTDVVNSNLLTHVVGCTGIVNKVAGWMTRIVQSKKYLKKVAQDKLDRTREQLMSACTDAKAGAVAAGDSIPIIGGLGRSVSIIFSKITTTLPSRGAADSLGAGPAGGLGQSLGIGGTVGTTGGDKVAICQEQVRSTDDKALQQLIDQTEADEERDLKTQCFDGIAITLARNQLTAMTRSMMNWVNSGYGGNPFFVQNMQRFTNSIERNVIETGIDILLAPSNKSPYASDFAKSTIRANRGIVSGSSKFLGGLQSDLQAFVSDPKSYYTNDQLESAQDTRDAVQRAQDANIAFRNDFSTGGWNAWLALTQKDRNNPLGFNMLASQYIKDLETQRVTEAKDELAQNNGFLSQKTCIEWQVYNDDGTPKTTYSDVNGLPGIAGSSGLVTSPVKPTSGPVTCTNWKTITPGSLIKEKTTAYLNSPERQLELAKTINDSLNALFSVLISKLQGGGLYGLADSYVDNTSNWTDNLNRVTSSDGNTPYDNNGAYGGFNLTRDLGNTYLHVSPVSLGTWNANTNTTSDGKKLYPDLAPQIYDANGDLTPSDNTYYRVSVAGKTKLMVEGYNGWEIGDRAFWNGSGWQNWKRGLPNPIKKRGVIQIQQDYIVAAKEILKVLPKIMPGLGELDYCIPGPNPSYETNSTYAQSVYQDWLASIFVGPIDASGERVGVRIHKPYSGTSDGGTGNEWSGSENGSRTYDILKENFSDIPVVWTSLFTSINPIIGRFSNIEGTSDYFYARNGNWSPFQTGAIDTMRKRARDIQEKTQRDFDNFFTAFGKKMNELYFNNFTQKYIEHETDPYIPPSINNDYIPMSVRGLDFTKNMLYYNDDIAKATSEYAEAINQARVNIAKLDPIKTEVSQIILAAQARRDARLLEQLNTYNAQSGTTLTEAQYRAKYAECLGEEDIQFFDVDEIITDGETGRCSNKIDDDFDGLIDMQDPDCGGGGTSDSGFVFYELRRCSDLARYSSFTLPSGTFYTGQIVAAANDSGGSSNYQVMGSSSETIPYVVGLVNPVATNDTSCGTSGVTGYTVSIEAYGGGVLSTATNQGTTISSVPVNEGEYTYFLAIPTAPNTKATFDSECGGFAAAPSNGNILYTTDLIYGDCTITVNFTP